MKKILFFVCLNFLSSFVFAQSPMWAEYQYNGVNYPETKKTFRTHTLQAFYSGKPMKKNSEFSINSFALASKGWGEVLLLPTHTKQTKIGLISTSLGLGVESGTICPRIGASIFYLKNRWECLLFFEQGTNETKNNWYLGYMKYKLVQHDEGVYANIGWHSQKNAVHGIRWEIGVTDDFLVWMVVGKANFKTKNYASLLGLRYFI